MTNSEQDSRTTANPKWFRQVLGQYPTGVCVITASPEGKHRAGMVVGSFTSVSLDPPLVAFLPDKKSSSWPNIEAAGKFCVNILGAEQDALCRRFASKAEDKFEDVPYRLGATGSPILEDTVAWIDCTIESILEAGDHYIVLGRVVDLQIESGGLPMLFFQGGYGQFSPRSLVAPDPLGAISEPLRHVDLIRSEMEKIAAELSARCIATSRVDDEIVITAGAGSSKRHTVSTLVGQRLPFIPPTGSVFEAWSESAKIDSWVSKTIPATLHESVRRSIHTIRDRGYSVGLINDAQRAFANTLARLADEGKNPDEADLREIIHGLAYDPDELPPDVQSDVRIITVPVFGPDSKVALALSLYDFAKPPADVGIKGYIERLLDTAACATRRIGGVAPQRA